MPINQDTHYVIKNGIVEQPAVVKDGLELYYDAKGKHNTDVHKDTLLDLSGNNRHGTLVNFAYEGVSGYQENGTGGILLDDVDDKIVRPAISGIEYTSASRNLFDLFGNTYSSSNCTITKFSNRVEFVNKVGFYSYATLKSSDTKMKLEPNTTYTISFDSVKDVDGYTVLNIGSNEDSPDEKAYGSLGVSTTRMSRVLVFTTDSNGAFKITFYTGTNSSPLTKVTIYSMQIEKGSVLSAYTPYIPLPIMTYQMNGNVLSFEKDGTVKRTTKDANGNEMVVSRKGINLVRNGNEVKYKKITSSYYTNTWYSAKLPTNDILYISVDVRAKDSDTSSIFMQMHDGISNRQWGYVTKPEKDVWYKSHGVVVPKVGGSTIEFMDSIRPHLIYDVNKALGKAFETKNAYAINLTEAYGAGNEPTLAYIQAHPEEFAWTPNPNDLIETVEIKNNLVGDLENLQGNDFEQHEDGVITYTNEAEEGSVVRVDIDGISDQPLRFRNATGEQVVITEHDQIDTDAIKKVEFQGNSVQLADKYREVSGTSVTIAPELHDKDVADKLVIGGNTTQYTESSNVVTDGLEMWLSGRNFSNSPATTVWKDLTGVNNGSASGFAYTVASGSDGNGGIVFDGVDDGIIGLPSQTVYDYSSFTLEVKCIIDSTSVATSIILGNRYREGIITSFLKLTPNMFEYYVDSVQHGIVNTVNRNTLVHLTIVKDKNTLKYFTNGELTSSKTLPIGLTMPPMPFGIGKDPFNTDTPEPFKGKINFVRKYGRALTDVEVLQNYNAGLAIPIPNIAMPQEVKHVTSGSKLLVHGKNLFNVNAVPILNTADIFTANPDGSFRYVNNSGLSKETTFLVKVSPGKQYNCWIDFISKTTNDCIIGVVLSDESGNAISNYSYRSSTTGSIILTTTKDTKNIRILITTQGKTTLCDYVGRIQIEEGATATPYELFKGYQETTIPVTLKSIG